MIATVGSISTGLCCVITVDPWTPILGSKLFYLNMTFVLIILCPYREVSEMEIRLEYERERRERLEAELDQLRKQLQHTAAELQHCQSLLRHHNKVCRLILVVL